MNLDVLVSYIRSTDPTKVRSIYDRLKIKNKIVLTEDSFNDLVRSTFNVDEYILLICSIIDEIEYITPLEKRIIKSNKNVINFIVEVGKLNSEDLEIEEESDDGFLFYSLNDTKIESFIKDLYKKCDTDYYFNN
jgi:hypothetical protein